MRISKCDDEISMLGKPYKNLWFWDIYVVFVPPHLCNFLGKFWYFHIERSWDYDRPSPLLCPPLDNSSISASDFLNLEEKNMLLQVFLLWSVGLWSRWQISFLRINLKGVLDNLAPRIRNGHFGTRTIWYPENLAKFTELKLPRI